MKQSLLICAAAALLAGSSCSEQEPFDAAMPVRLSVAGISPGSRAAANYAADDYFGLRGMAGASVSVKARTTTYIYADGTLAGATPDDVLYFPVDGSALASVKVYWPEEAVRQAQGGAIAKDQREKERRGLAFGRAEGGRPGAGRRPDAGARTAEAHIHARRHDVGQQDHGALGRRVRCLL